MKIKLLLAVILLSCVALIPASRAQVADGDYAVTESWTVKIEYSNYGNPPFTGVTNISGTTTGTIHVAGGQYALVPKFGTTATDKLATNVLFDLTLQYRHIAKAGDTYSISGTQVFYEQILPSFTIAGLSYYGMAMLGCFAIHIDMRPGDSIASAPNPVNYSASGPAGAIQGGGTFPNQSAKVTVTSRVSFGVPPPENIPPTVKIATPINNFHTPASSISLTGTAADNKGVAGVEVTVGANTQTVSVDAGGAWAATVDLAKGANTIQVRSKDTSDNRSTVQSITVFRDAASKLTITQSGVGTVTPNLNGSDLIVGKSYTIMAKPAAGFTFAGWDLNGVAKTTPSLTFTMSEDLVIGVAFADTTAPEVTVKSPKNNDRLNTDTVSVQGTVKDNFQVGHVFVQVNDDAPQVANGTSNWSLSVHLKAGPNTIRVYADDVPQNVGQAPLRSKTNTFTVSYVKTAIFQLEIDGPGKIVPNLLGQSLEVGKSYTVAATPNAGSKFVRWEGTSNSTSAKLTFVMSENFFEAVVFSDATAPTVSIVSPKPNERLTTLPILASGKATDNGTLGFVQFRVDNNGPLLTASGTANWTASLDGLQPGSHTLQVFSVDSGSNTSKTASVTFTYVQSAQFAATVQGPGKIAPNLNGLLEIGKSYTITATANAGAKFAGWTGSSNTSSAKLTFVMVPGFQVTAVFQDATAPTVTVISPKPNDRLTTLPILASGKATDNGTLGFVQFRVDNNGPLLTASGTANWTASLDGLQPGSHTLQVFSVDSGSNTSKTASVTFTYVQSAPFTASIQGPGKIAPNLNGQSLELGKTYTITATANAGAKFAGWTGSSNTSSAKLTFVMAPGFQVTAVFQDATAPTVTVISPKPNERLTTLPILASGKAADNGTVESVHFRVDNGEWLTATGKSNWTASVTEILPGPHTLQVYSVDGANLPSKTASVTFTYVQSAQFMATIHGPGKIAPNLNGQSLELGKTYTITATANAGAKFEGWIGSSNTPSAKLTFVMTPGFQVTAVFEDGTAPIVKIVSPKPNEQVLSAEFIASGTASDNGTVRQVFFSLDHQPFSEATGTNAWTADLGELEIGSHTLDVFALDDFNNKSKTNSITFTRPDFKGIYMGTFHTTSGPAESGIVTVLIRADGSAVFLGGGLDFSENNAFFESISVAADGTLLWPVGSDNGVVGKVSGTGISGTFTSRDNGAVVGGGVFSLTRKADTGPQASNAGFYDNMETADLNNTGLIRGILAADGSFIFNVNSDKNDDNNDNSSAGAGKLTFTAANTFSGIVDVAPTLTTVTGTITPSTHTINGHYKNSEDEGTFTLVREFTVNLELGAGLAPASRNQGATADIASNYGVSMSSNLHNQPSPPVPLLRPIASATSTPLEVSVVELGNDFVISFKTEPGQTYTVETSSDLATWTTSAQVTADSNEATFAEPVATTPGPRFYRVVAN